MTAPEGFLFYGTAAAWDFSVGCSEPIERSISPGYVMRQSLLLLECFPVALVICDIQNPSLRFFADYTEDNLGFIIE